MTDATLPALIQQMTQPEFYPHPVQEPIQLIQTHISYILLTGEFAYKVKKPLDFGFLNYSTLELRQHFCQEEVRLNKRGAAEIYLEALPLTQTGEQFSLKGAGETVDYAVKMRQFPQDTLLTKLYERGELTPELLKELAIAVAQFHLNAETDDHIRSFGSVASVREAFDQNYEQTEKYIGGPQTQQQFDETQAATDRFFTERADLLESRVKNNWIRACHGDIHLGNIAYWNNELLLFDCIEFNEPFRLVDVMYDIAYIVMDLEMRERPDLATLFLNTYIEQTGDWEGLEILPLYVSRQAYVRGKVISFLLDDPAVPQAEKEKAAAIAAPYYKLAWKAMQPRTGRLLLMSGLSGAGKSTTARAIAAKINAVQIRSDAVRKHLGGVPLNERGSDDLYSAEMTQKTYSRLLEVGVLLAKAGYSVILDAKYDRQSLREVAIAQAKAANLPLQIIYCDAPPEVLQTRVQQRTGDIADATTAVLAKQSFESFSEAEKSTVISIDTTGDLTEQLTQLV